MCSRGSVIPFFMETAKTGKLTITDRRMTRFMISLEQGVELVWHAFDDMEGGEIYVKKIPSMNICDIARAVDDAGNTVDNYSIVDWGIRGIAIDNYVAYNFGFMNLQAAVPVTIRFGDQHTGNAGNYCDPSYLTWNVKASIPQDFGTVYILCNSGGTSIDPEALVLTDYTSENFGIAVRKGNARLKAALDVAIEARRVK